MSELLSYALAAIVATAGALPLYAFVSLLIQRWHRNREGLQPVTSWGPATARWRNYETERPSDGPGTEYLVTDGCTYWTASYEDALGVFEPFDWSVTHFTPILPPQEPHDIWVPRPTEPKKQ